MNADTNLLINNISKCMKSILTDFHDNKNDSLISDDYDDDTAFPATVDSCKCTTLTDTALQKLFNMKLNKFKSLATELNIWNLLEQQSFSCSSEIEICSCVPFGGDCRSPGKEGGCVSCEKDYQWTFTKNCLLLITLLDLLTTNCNDKTKIQNRLQHQPNTLCVRDLKLVEGIVQLVIAFGIWPYLLPGIGKPLPTKSLSACVKPSKRENRRKLFLMVKPFLCLMKNKELSGQILPLVCGDLLAALIQLSYKNQNAEDILCSHRRNWCRIQLGEFIERSYQPLIIKELLVLQRCSVIAKTSSSIWFCKRIGDRLSTCLLQENGVANVTLAIVDGMPGKLNLATFTY